MKINITATGGISTGEKVKGVKYLSDDEAKALAREKNIDAVFDKAGNIIGASIHDLTDEEKQVIGEQVVEFGENAGKKLKDLPVHYALALGEVDEEGNIASEQPVKDDKPVKDKPANENKPVKQVQPVSR